VWHASVAWQRIFLPDSELRRIAFELLDGYGDPAAGQWEEKGASAFHLRRRLTETEAALVGPVVDIRGTPEASQRVWAVRKWVVAARMTEFAAGEVNPPKKETREKQRP
jgi:hypothetical protein